MTFTAVEVILIAVAVVVVTVFVCGWMLFGTGDSDATN